ncbi:hypothetical protein ACFOON_16535 [Novosphingobium piscinae]|uniref:DUF883 domain-containing protein n=1 Tax=Novosphingobium piscinae TaxID=1507448 RepID=A0A7X1FYM2_9SPHN|nr:hypothetical protein [Novosphingobium piscinae]MBC2669398.1 hypothetical protein [Novosphingobium piscinae]
MADSTVTPAKAKPARKPRAPKAAAPVESTPAAATPDPKAKFAKAIEEAKAGATALSTQVQDTAGAYREKVVGQGEALIEDAKAAAAQAKEKAAALAKEGKVRAVDGIATVSKLVAENAPVIDEKLGAKYGDYARSAARSLDETAAKLEAKDLGELGEDARAFVRKSPALAVGIAAAFGFLVSRLFRGSAKTDD